MELLGYVPVSILDGVFVGLSVANTEAPFGVEDVGEGFGKESRHKKRESMHCWPNNVEQHSAYEGGETILIMRLHV